MLQAIAMQVRAKIDDRWVERTGWLLVMVSVLGMVFVSSQGLWNSLMGGLETFGGVAEIARMDGNVRWRPISHLAWQSPSLHQDLSLGDRVATSSEGPAMLQYEVGVQVEVGPSSLVVIDEPRGRLQGWDSMKGRFEGAREITLNEGTLTLSNLNPGEEFGVRFEDKKYRVAMDGKGSKLKVFRRDRGGIGFQPSAASATIQSAAWLKPLKVLDGQTGIAPESGQPYAVKTPFMGNTPSLGVPLFIRPGQSVNFNWERTDPRAKSVPDLEIRAVPNQDQPKSESMVVPGRSQRVSKSLNDGAYQWRVAGKDATGRNFETPWKSFSVVSLKPPSPILPRANKAHITSPKGVSEVYLAWRPRVLPSPVQVEVLKKGRVINQFRTRSPGGMSVSLAPGEYSWRARVWIKKDFQSAWSKPRKFSVVDRGKVLSVSIDTQEPEVTQGQASLSWTPISFVDSYLVELYSDQQSSIRRESVAAPTYVVKRGEVTDRFYYQVSATFSDDTSTSTRLIPVDFKLAEPKEIQPARAVLEGSFKPEDGADFVIGDEVNFLWPSSNLANEYVLEIGTEEDFVEPIAVVVLKKSQFVFRPPLSGLYYWRVRVVTSDADSSRDWSEVRSLSVH